MALTFKTNAGSGDFGPVAAGSHIAICGMVAYLGLQPGSDLYPKPKAQVYVRWEIPTERIEFEKDGKKISGPAVIGKIYTASMNEKANLRHDLENWRGRQFTDEQAEAFDVAGILGKPCILNVTHKTKDGKTRANVTGVGSLMKGVDPKTIIPELPLIYYGPDQTGTYDKLPEWIRKLIDGQILEKPAAQQQQTGNQLDDGSFISDNDLPSEMNEDPDPCPF